MKNIVLCGFMGSGKTTVGRKLAALLGCEFVDMDECIAERAGMPVDEIFASRGESAFRALETETARVLSGRGGLVISTGGGALLNPRNVALLRQNGVIVFIDIPLTVIARRLVGDRSRPLLNRPDREEAMAQLFAHRRPLYRAAADVTATNDDNLPADTVAREIAAKLAAGYPDFAQAGQAR